MTEAKRRRDPRNGKFPADGWKRARKSLFPNNLESVPLYAFQPTAGTALRFLVGMELNLRFCTILNANRRVFPQRAGKHSLQPSERSQAANNSRSSLEGKPQFAGKMPAAGRKVARMGLEQAPQPTGKHLRSSLVTDPQLSGNKPAVEWKFVVSNLIECNKVRTA